MTDTTFTLRGERGFALRLRLWLGRFGRRRREPPAALDLLSDHMRRDIGVERDPLEEMSIRTLHDAMRYSG